MFARCKDCPAYIGAKRFSGRHRHTHFLAGTKLGERSFGAPQPLPVLEPDKDKAQLLGDLRLRRQVFRQRVNGRVDDIRQGGEHAFNDQVGHDAQPGNVQVLQLRHSIARVFSGQDSGAL